MYLYSPSTNGFYQTEIHSDNIPNDVVKVSDERHAELYEAGMSIIAGADGQPEISPPAAPDPELAAKEAAKASALAKLQALGLTEAEAAAIAGL